MVYTIYPNRAGFFFFFFSASTVVPVVVVVHGLHGGVYIYVTGRVSQGNMITVSNIICTVTAYYSKGLPTQIRSIYSRLYKQQKNIT